MRYNVRCFGGVLPVIYCKDINYIRNLIVQKDKLFGIDLETCPNGTFKPGLDPRCSYIRLLQIYDGSTSYVIDLQFIQLQSLKEFLLQNKFYSHYGQFERGHLLHNLGVHVDIYCTLVMAQMYECAREGDKKFTWSLQDCVSRYLGEKLNKEMQVSNWADQLTDAQIVYAGVDAIACYKLGEFLANKIELFGMVPAWKVVRSCSKVVAEMQYEGFKVDRHKLTSLINQWEVKKAVANVEVTKHFPGVNVNSSKQLQDWLVNNSSPEMLSFWPKTERGAYSFSAKALADFKQSDAIKALISFKEVDKLLNTYGTTLLEKIHPLTGRLHTSFTEQETDTGRFSSKEPNLQNAPRDAEFRACFVPEEGNVFVIADFSQIEVRVAGEVSGDQVILDTYREGRDIYKKMASIIYRKPESEITKAERQISKSAVLGLEFGMGATRFRDYVKNSIGEDLGEDECIRIHRLYHSEFANVYSKWCEGFRRQVEVAGFTTTMLGKKRALKKDEVYTRAVNTRVQGTAAEILKCALVYCLDGLKGLGKIVNCIHDEVIIECSREHGDFCKTVLEASMVKGYQYVFPNGVINGLASATICESWADK